MSLTIKILDNKNSGIGSLVKIGPEHTSDPAIVESLTDWRNHYQDFFLSRFSATPERTKKWLDQTILPDSSRILFLIEASGHYIGHLGLKNITKTSVELDNLIRGKSEGHPQLIYYAELALINWVRSELGIQHFFAFVLSNNFFALQFHRTIGFEQTKAIPLIETLNGSERILLPAGEKGTPHSEIHYIQMELHYN